MPPRCEHWDAVVIGAGPAGCLSARLLAGQGLRTLLVERQRLPRRKVCGCCLNAGALTLLRGLDLEPPTAPILREARFQWGGREIGLPLEGGIALGRDELDSWLAGEARRAGAELMDDTTATIGPMEGTRRVLALKEGTGGEQQLTASVVIGAGGLSFQPTLEGVSWRSPRWFVNRLGAGALLEPESPGPPPGRIDLLFGRDGYVGLVRLGDGSVDAAAALSPALVRKHGSLGRAASALCGEDWPEVAQALGAAPWKGTPPLTRRATRVFAPGVLLVGDATGYAEPFSGEGMGWALRSALLAAPIAARCGADGWEPRHGHHWQGVWERSLGRSLFRCLLAARVLRTATGTGCLRALLHLPAVRNAALRRFT